jgi:phosphatidylserine/phosphatidylglycerophosphate/cardiolipin synthase-like enzyme
MKTGLRLTLTVPVLLLFAACSLSPAKVRQVDARVAASRQHLLSCEAEQVDRCSANSPLLEFSAESIRSGRHHLTLLDVGEPALMIRIHLIRAARENIELQNFILRRDDTGGLVLNELLNAARRGVRVRLLLDQMFSFSDLEYLVMLTMAHANFEIRFYNPSFDKAKMAKHDWISAVACCFRRFNQRMHNKLLVADGLVGILGGRNIADRYFDFDTQYDFKDRDVVVYGSTVQEMEQSFELFWNGPRSVPAQHLRDVARVLLNDGENQVQPYQPPERLLPLLERLGDEQLIRELFIEPAFMVERLEYYSDLPRKVDFPQGSEHLDPTAALLRVLQDARHSVLIQSPYMVLSKDLRRVFGALKEEKSEIELVFSTNSLASTDADSVYANTHKHKKRYVKKLGFAMYEFKPYPQDAAAFIPRWLLLTEEKARGITSEPALPTDDSTVRMPVPRIGLHSKSFVVDGEIAMIGSHNFDPRSEDFNTENGIIVRDRPFAQMLEALIRRDIEPQNSWVVAMRPDKRTMAAVSRENGDSIQPRYDYYFYGSTSAFELIPGKKVVPPGSADFYRNYYSVGSFPGVTTTQRQINVLLLGSLFGFLEPVF